MKRGKDKSQRQDESRVFHRLDQIIARARRMERIRDGLVLCDNCDTPASRTYSTALSWTACGPCATGEASTIEPGDFISVE